jgi:hypothetical protein
MRISIDTGEIVTQLSPAPVFNFTDSSVEVVGNQVILSPTVKADINHKDYILTINGVAPNSNGEFFIDGSACDSWGIIAGGTESITGEPAIGRGISIVDLCPACTTCESIYRLQYEVEGLKLWLNTLKDVNLYMDQDMSQRRSNLSGLRITGSPAAASCNITLNEDDAYMHLRSAQLLQQYITVVHMWNYVVSQNNASNNISIAPEDTAGFVVQTKRAVPSCSSQQTVKCEITVADPTPIFDADVLQPAIPEDYDISIYVPQRSMTLTFEPFLDSDNEWKALGTAGIHAESTTSTSSKHVYTDVIDAKVAGTYVVTAKFLPFVYYHVWRDAVINGTTVHESVSVRGGKKASYTEEQITGGTLYTFGISGFTVSAEANPTETMYLDAHTAPTCSVNFKLSWPINIKWTITDIATGQPKIYNEDYIYVANGVRMYFSSASITGSTVLDPPEPEPESTTTQGQG